MIVGWWAVDDRLQVMAGRLVEGEGQEITSRERRKFYNFLCGGKKIKSTFWMFRKYLIKILEIFKNFFILISKQRISN